MYERQFMIFLSYLDEMTEEENPVHVRLRKQLHEAKNIIARCIYYSVHVLYTVIDLKTIKNLSFIFYVFK